MIRDAVATLRFELAKKHASTGSHSHSGTATCTGSVILAQHGDFKGWQAQFPKGKYNHLNQRGARDNDASSIIVPNGCEAYLFGNGNFGGWKATFKPGRYDYRKFIAAGGRNDQASSLIVGSN